MGTLKQYHSHKLNTQYVHLCSAHTSNIFSSCVMMFSVGWLATPPEEQQSVLPGSLGDCLASWPYHWAMRTRFQLGWCQGTLQGSPSHQSQHQRGTLCKLWQCVVECCHAETSLPLYGSAWMAPLVVAIFCPCTTLHWGSPGSLDQYGAIQKSHPTPYEMYPLHICLFHWCMGLPVFCFFISTLSLLHQPSQARTGFSSDIRIWFWIWFWIWIWSFISRGTKEKW